MISERLAIILKMGDNFCVQKHNPQNTLPKNIDLIKLFFPDIDKNQYDIEKYEHQGDSIIIFIREKNLVP